LCVERRHKGSDRGKRQAQIGRSAYTTYGQWWGQLQKYTLPKDYRYNFFIVTAANVQ